MSKEYLSQELLRDALTKMRLLWQSPCSTAEFNDGVRALVAASDEAVETIKRLRKIAAYVPSRIYIEAKEKAGFAEMIVTTASAQETKVAEPEPPHGSEDWWHLKPYGYAPGGYIIRCHTCKQQAWNCDKRALNCASCATKAWRKANEQG